MAIVYYSGPQDTQPFLKVASTQFTAGTVLGWIDTGYVTKCVAASLRVAGVSLRKVSSTDSDYANNTETLVSVPSDRTIYLADVSGTAAIGNVGKQYDFTTATGTTATSVNLSGTSFKMCTVVGIVSTSQVLIKINGVYTYANKAN